MQVQADVSTIRDKDALAGTLQTLLLEGGQLLEEAGDVEDGSRADEVDTRGGDQAGGKDVEVVSLRAVNDGMTRIWVQSSQYLPLSGDMAGWIEG